MQLTDIVVHGTIGAGGNHVRWLLLLDQSFLFFNLDTVDKKLDFIKTHVYPKTRTAQNWLDYEQKYRRRLDQYISFKHTSWANGWEYRKQDFSIYNVYVNSDDVELIYKLYYKLNPGLNNTSKQEFLRQVLNEHNESICCLNNWHKGIQVDTKDLYQPILDKDLYLDLIKYCNLNDNYVYCNEIHKLWFELHNKESGPDGKAADC